MLLFQRSDCNICIYRTGANGVEFNKITSDLAPLLNNINVTSVTFYDSASDDSILSNSPIYTSGGVLNNISPPANSLIVTYGNRLFLSGLEDGNLLMYSQNKYDDSNFNTVPTEWCAELIVGVESGSENGTGPITAIANLNGNLIIFKENTVFILNGEGPDNTGLNGSFPIPSLISADVGCINPNSIVITGSLGLMFQSNKGIYQLDQNQNLSYIGAQVEQYNSYTITSSTLLANYNQVIFTTLEGISLVYDYYYQQWSTWTNMYAVDGTNWKNNFVYLDEGGNVMVMDTTNTVWTNPTVDDSITTVPINLGFTLPDITFSGLNAYQMCYWMTVLGTYMGPTNLIVNIAYNNNPAFTETLSIPLNPTADGYYWQDGYYGSTSVPLQFQYNFANKLGTSIRVQIMENNVLGNEGFRISNIGFYVAAVPGMVTLPATRRYGGLQPTGTIQPTGAAVPTGGFYE